MHFYRRLTTIKAMTFDLDDTLYDNRPVMANTERQVLIFLQQRFPEFAGANSSYFHGLRSELRQQEPDIYHDVEQWRWRSLELALLNHGYSAEEASSGASEAMDEFACWRSQIEVPPSTHETLTALGQHFPLVAITNGNANPYACGLGDYFEFILKAGLDGRSKPFSDMFSAAAQRLDLAPQYLLHIGDHLATDVAGAVRNGLQACWINDRKLDLMQEPNARLLPHIEISRLASLQALL